MDKPFKFCIRRSVACARTVNDKIRLTSHKTFVHYHVAALQIASNVRGEVDEVREDRDRLRKRRERYRLRRLLVLIGETSPTNMPCTVPEVEAAVKPANSDTSIVKSHVGHLMDTHAYRTVYFE